MPNGPNDQANVLTRVARDFFGVELVEMNTESLYSRIAALQREYLELIKLTQTKGLDKYQLRPDALRSLRGAFPFFDGQIRPSESSSYPYYLCASGVPMEFYAGNSMEKLPYQATFYVTAPRYSYKVFFGPSTVEIINDTKGANLHGTAIPKWSDLDHLFHVPPVGGFSHPHASDPQSPLLSLCTGSNPFLTNFRRHKVKDADIFVRTIYYMLIWLKTVNVDDCYGNLLAPRIVRWDNSGGNIDLSALVPSHMETFYQEMYYSLTDMIRSPESLSNGALAQYLDQLVNKLVEDDPDSTMSIGIRGTLCTSPLTSAILFQVKALQSAWRLNGPMGQTLNALLYDLLWLRNFAFISYVFRASQWEVGAVFRSCFLNALLYDVVYPIPRLYSSAASRTPDLGMLMEAPKNFAYLYDECVRGYEVRRVQCIDDLKY